MIRFFVTSLTALVCFASVAAAAHPYHVSRAEIQYNAQRGTFEVALCVWPADLEKAIGQMEKKAIDLDTLTQAQRDAAVAKYVTSRFRVLPEKSAVTSAASPTGDATIASESRTVERCQFRWVGSEMNLKQAWLYFEVTTGADTRQWSFENRMFFELNEDQLNQVQIQSVGRRRPGISLFSRTLSASQPGVVWSKQ